MAIGPPISHVSVRGSLSGQALVEVLAQGVDELSQVLVPPEQAVRVSPTQKLPHTPAAGARLESCRSTAQI